MLLFAGVFGHAMWLLSDSVIGYKTQTINAAFSGAFLLGIALAGYGVFK